MPHFFEPNEVSTIAGLTPDKLRDWRRRNLLDDVGTELANGRWVYSFGDVSLLAISGWLLKAGFVSDLKPALRIAARINAVVWNFIAEPDHSEIVERSGRYFMVLPEGSIEQRWTIAFPTAEALRGYPAATVIDCKVLAETLSPSLRAMIEQREGRHT